MEYTTLSIASLGPATLPKEEKKQIRGRESNDVSDIEGTRTINKYEKYTNKPQFLNSEVAGATSKVLSHSRNVPDRTLEIDDIDGTRFFIRNRFFRTQRKIDPLQPNYNLPSYIPAEPVEPKFIRDTLYHDDVDGSRTKPPRPFQPRDTMGVNDIEGAQVNWKPRNERVRSEGPPTDIMAIEGVNTRNIRHQDRSSRLVNTLNPVYEFDGMIIEDDKYSKPRKPKPFIPENNLLKTADITGATAGWHTFTGKEVRNINFIADIKGAQADTIKHSIITTRSTHPLLPVYQALDDGEPLLPLNKPLIPASLVKVATLTSTNIDKYENQSSSVSYANKFSGRQSAEAESKENSSQDQKLNFSSSIPQLTFASAAATAGGTQFGSSSGLAMSGMNSINFGGTSNNNSGRNSDVKPTSTDRKPSFSRASPASSARAKATATFAERQQQSAREADIEAVRLLK